MQLEADTVSQNVEKQKNLMEESQNLDMSKLARTPKNISSGERIAEENQPLTCQNTVARKQDNDMNQ